MSKSTTKHWSELYSNSTIDKDLYKAHINAKYDELWDESQLNDMIQDNKRVFETGSQRDDDSDKPLPNHLDPYLRLRFGYLLRMGGNRYGKGNWRLGQPTETALESLHRHLAKYELGCREEDHLSAIIFNVMLIMKNEEKEGISVDKYYKKS